MKLTQTEIAKKMGVSITFINCLVNAKKRPSWQRAKQIAEITKTDPVLWLEGSKEDIKQALTNQTPPEAA